VNFYIFALIPIRSGQSNLHRIPATEGFVWPESDSTGIFIRNAVKDKDLLSEP
jgi:hypothetical protein